jgi:hypothetical protein
MSGADVPTFRALAVAAAIAAATLVPASASAAAPGWKMTHKVTIEGKFVNHWTISDDQDCGPVGDGTLTVKFHTTVATRVRPYLDDYAGGGWNVAVPHGYKGHLLTAMDYAKVAGTITRVDNTTPRPFAEMTEPCSPLSRRGCGTFPLSKKSGAYVYGGHRPSRISVHAATNFESGGCLIGDASTFDATRALVGGNQDGNVLVKMPRASAFKRRVVRIGGKTHKRSAWGDPGYGTSTNDISRKVTVTFKRL